jgi:hypothetical protein
MEEIIDQFLVDMELNVALKEPLCDCFSACMGALAKHILDKPIPADATPSSKSQKVLKADKIEDPSTVQNIEELRNCTTGTLNEFCRKVGLKVGGNKAQIMDRVWRHLQGTGSDEDMSSRTKPKKEKKVVEKHECSGCNSKGAPCAVGGTEQYKGHWFCWRHILDPDSFIALKPSADADSEASTSTSTGVVKKVVDALEKKKKKPVPKELVSEEEEE